MGIKSINSEFVFSIFENLFSNRKLQEDIDVNDLIEQIKYGFFKKKIEDLRSVETKAEYDRIKKESLPAITLSGSFNKRCKEGLVNHSGLIQIDIDDIKDSDYDALFKCLCNDPFTYLCFRSPGGKGIKIVVKINPSAETHLEQFNALQKYYREDYKTKIDKSCKDIARCMLLSWDPDLFCNPFSEGFAEMCSEEKEDRTIQPQISTRKIKVHSESLNETIEAIISEIESNKIDLTSDFDDWIRIGFALISAFGEGGRSYFNRISKMFPGYTYEETEKKYSQLLTSKGSGVKIGSLIWIAKNHGIEITRHTSQPKYYKYAEKVSIAAEEEVEYKTVLSKHKQEDIKTSDNKNFTSSSDELRVLLKKFRLDLARKAQISAFLVFYDSTLEEMIVSRPRNINELYNIRGLGEKKIKWFGREILEILKKFD